MQLQESRPRRFLTVSRSILDVIAAIAMIVAAAVLIWPTITQLARGKSRSEIALPTEPISLEGAATEGKRDADIGLIVYSDFQCPYCGSFAREVLPVLRTKYVSSGQVLIAFRHMPMDRIHPWARSAAIAAWCAQQQGLFVPLHDRLFAQPQSLDEGHLREKAIASGVNIATWEACAKSTEAAAGVQLDLNQGLANKVVGTPTAFLGRLESGRLHVTTRFFGARPVDDYTAAIGEMVQ